MNDDVKNALPGYDKDEIGDPVGFFRTLFRLKDIQEERSIPAIVVDKNEKTGILKVRPLLKRTFNTKTGDISIDRDIVTARPLKICHGGFAISIPLLKGDSGILFATDRKYEEAAKKNMEPIVGNQNEEQLKDRTAEPDDCSILRFDGGFFLPCSFVPDTGNGNSLVIRGIRNANGEVDFTNTDTAHGVNAWSSVEIESGGRINICGNGNRLSVREGGLYYEGESQKTVKLITDLDEDEQTGQLMMKYVTGSKSGELITNLSEESDWVPIGKEKPIPITMIKAMTEWKFDQSKYFKDCNALINDQVVCSGHATSHIIDYAIANHGGYVEDYYNSSSGRYEFYFTMSIKLINPSDYNKQGPVEFRCWNKNYHDFDSCPESERASYTATAASSQVVKPMFLVTLDKKTMKWTFSFTGQI